MPMRRLILLVLTSCLALVLGFHSLKGGTALLVVKYGGYWIVAVSFFLFLGVLITSLRSGPFLGWRTGLIGASCVLLGTSFLHTRERHEFKIVADEILLSSTAMQMHLNREASVVVRAYEYAGNIVPMGTIIDKRPLVFPFLVSLAHDLTGYRPSNIFWVNGVVTVMLLWFLFLIGTRIGGCAAGVSAVTLLCTIPLVSQNASGSGFELLNMASIVMVLWLGMRLVENIDGVRLSAFVLGGILLSQVRYESVMFVIPVGVLVICVWVKERKAVLSWPVIFSPLLMLLVPLQHNVFKMREAAWQLNDIEGATTPFSTAYFYDNIGHAINFFLSFDGRQPSAWPLAVAGCLAVGLSFMLFYREYRTIWAQARENLVLVIFLAGLILHTVMMLCYFWGRWDDVLIRRLSLPAHVLFIIAILFVWVRLFKRPSAWAWLTGSAMAVVMLITIPASAKQQYNNENFAARTANWIAQKARREEGRRVLAIDQNAGLVWFLYQQSSVPLDRIKERPDAFYYHYKIRTFDDIYVVQRFGKNLADGSMPLSLSDDLGPAVVLEKVEEKQFAPDYLIRISRVVSIDEKGWLAWVENNKPSVKPSDHKSTEVKVIRTDPNLLKEWVKNLP